MSFLNLRAYFHYVRKMYKIGQHALIMLIIYDIYTYTYPTIIQNNFFKISICIYIWLYVHKHMYHNNEEIK